MVTKDKCLLEKILNKYPKAIYYEQMRVDYKNGYSNVNMSDEDFALMNCQHLFQLEEAAKCKYIKSVDCSDGKLVSIITENQFEYL